MEKSLQEQGAQAARGEYEQEEKADKEGEGASGLPKSAVLTMLMTED